MAVCERQNHRQSLDLQLENVAIATRCTWRHCAARVIDGLANFSWEEYFDNRRAFCQCLFCQFVLCMRRKCYLWDFGKFLTSPLDHSATRFATIS